MRLHCVFLHLGWVIQIEAVCFRVDEVRVCREVHVVPRTSTFEACVLDVNYLLACQRNVVEYRISHIL